MPRYAVLSRSLIGLLSLLLCLPGTPVLAAEANTKITHKPLDSVPAGQRITLEAKVKDPAGVAVVRAYFKAAEGADFHFVPMTGKGQRYRAILPAPAAEAGSLDYLILVKNAADQVVKSQTFRATVEASDEPAAATAPEDPLQVYTELAEAPAEIPGFTDNLVIDTVESAAKFGAVAGIVAMSKTGGAASGGAATAGTASAGSSTVGGTAVSAGTVSAGTGAGLSTTTVLAIAGGVAAVGGGAAVAASGGGDGGDDEAAAEHCTTLEGDWSFALASSRCPGQEAFGTVRINATDAGYDLAWTITDNLDLTTCEPGSSRNCSDTLTPPDHSVAEAELTQAFNASPCTNAVQWAQTDCETDRITATGSDRINGEAATLELTR